MVLFNIITRRSADCRCEKHEMRRPTSTFCVPVALCATGLALFFLAGCGKETPPAAKEPPRHSPASYMNDPEFRKTIADDRKEMQRIAAQCKVRADRMQQLVEQYGEDEGKLQNVPEWVRLKREVKDLKARYEEVHKRQLATVRARIRPDGTKTSN